MGNRPHRGRLHSPAVSGFRLAAKPLCRLLVAHEAACSPRCGYRTRRGARFAYEFTRPALYHQRRRATVHLDDRREPAPDRRSLPKADATGAWEVETARAHESTKVASLLDALHA